MTPDQYAHIIKLLMDIKELLQGQHKPRPRPQLHPATMVIEVCSKILDESFTATAVRILLPVSERSGERKAVTEASIHQAGTTESSIMALGKVLQMVGLQNPKKLLIRVVCDADVVHIIDFGKFHPYDPNLSYIKKAEYLSEDIENLRKRIEIQSEYIGPENPEYEELMSLIFEAETEYYLRQEKNNESGSSRNSPGL